ncbi:MAG: hypothetical protein A3D16_00880 [Rhodobacterales bacterium RIFCSPHIGHO2_02_FULL_62_130]|nr:MAG: hypothetical protein A3D16_00880 [Rhodobacterales bacterium RIFCSPHIGHO2_02_FULL_62_130]OHC55020.1 MAG: hypothetical protein A3E48_10525 [Rhodobacterales bacterium RIFCSPHIGHO2_12_FULL_62_75]HCY99529.1 hypothetical protein [Rhodobacter sp.]
MDDFSGQAILDSLADLSAGQVTGALVAVALAFFAVAGQERAVVQHLGLDIAPAAGGKAAVAAAAVSQTAGFGPLVGAIIRRKLVPGLSLGQSFAISLGMAIGFFTGLGLLALACFAVMPAMPYQGWARLLLALIGIGATGLALWPRPLLFGRRKPNLIVMARFLFWLGLDVTALGATLWILLPQHSSYGFLDLLPVFFIALGIGLASGSPGGAGPFEATLLTQSPEIEGSGLLAGIIAFRAIAYALPAILGAIWALVAPRVKSKPPIAPVALTRWLTEPALRALPCAEAQLVRQQELHLIALRDSSALWLSGALAHVRVMFGAPLTRGASAQQLATALGRLTRLARDEARLPCLYKATPRLAAAARAQGWTVLPVAKEAVLDPQTFSLAGAERARLRRKLAHARKGGITVQMATALPVAAMERVAQAWCNANHQERGFSMGRWSVDYVTGQRVFTAYTDTGELCAFVTFHAARDEWTLDLLRVVERCTDGTIYALICHALEHARAEGVSRLSLAAVPQPDLGLTGWKKRMAVRLTGRSTGLTQFKSAFAPRWEQRYIAAKGVVPLAIAALEIAVAIHRPSPHRADRIAPLRVAMRSLLKARQ